MKRLEALNQASLESINLNSERAIVKKFIDAGIEVLDADFGFCFIRNKKENSFRLLYKDKNTPYTPRTPRSDGITSIAFKTRKPHLVSNVKQAGIIRSDARAAMKAVAVVPMSYKRANYGTLNFCYLTTHEFTKEQKSLCQYIGHSIANTITIYRLLNEQKAALAAREQFLAIVSHELKTPITSMSMYAQHLLSMAKKRGAQEKEVDGLEVINRQIVRLTKLVNDILVFTKFDRGMLQLHLDYVDLAELTELALKQMKLTAGERKLQFKHDNDLVVMGDRDRLEQVLINLLSNAIKFSPTDSTITIEERRNKNQVTVSVTDEGMGIPEDKLKNVFDKFFQAHNSNVSGFGLGLYISKQIIDQHGGSIRVESRLGKGTTFSFFIPTTSKTDI